MNSSIYTDVVEWMAKIVKPQKALGNVSICPYAKKASWAIVECNKIDIDIMEYELKMLNGEHDFSSFRSSSCNSKNPTKRNYKP